MLELAANPQIHLFNNLLIWFGPYILVLNKDSITPSFDDQLLLGTGIHMKGFTPFPLITKVSSCSLSFPVLYSDATVLQLFTWANLEAPCCISCRSSSWGYLCDWHSCNKWKKTQGGKQKFRFSVGWMTLGLFLLLLIICKEQGNNPFLSYQLLSLKTTHSKAG